MNYLLPPFHRRTWSARWVGHNTQHLRGVNCIINAFHPPKFSPFSSQSFKLVSGWTIHLKHMLVKNGCIFPRGETHHLPTPRWPQWPWPSWSNHLGPARRSLAPSACDRNGDGPGRVCSNWIGMMICAWYILDMFNSSNRSACQCDDMISYMHDTNYTPIYLG